MEIERKFLVKDINAINEIISKYSKKTITQDYLYVDDYTAVRKRKIEKSGNTKYVYTVKTMKVGISVNEFEKEITKEEYEALKINAEYITLSKDRYVIPYVDDLKIEVDVFKGVYEGVVFAEIEFKSEEQAAQIELPKWFDKEMSQIITNSKMATKNMREKILANELNEELVKYIKDEIFPKYEKFYSHGMLHINNVIKNSMMLAYFYNLDRNMCYTIAAYHDYGLNLGRDNHEYNSAQILYGDKNLRKYFTDEQLNIMKEAIEDHRGSRKERPRNIYGEVVSDSDRDFDIEMLAKRQLATSIKNYTELKQFDEQFERCYKYILGRINEQGNFNLWTNNPILIEKRKRFEKDYLNKEFVRKIYKKEWDEICTNGLKEKLQNYYEDF